METVKTVVDEKEKLTDEQIGKIQRKTNEIVRRINEGTIKYEDSLEVMQKIIIENESAIHLDVISGKASITYRKHIIDCDAQPFIPQDWKVKEHRQSGLIEFDPSKISFYLSRRQNKGKVYGHTLIKELSDKPVMNANVLDYLLVNQQLIPDDWKGKNIFFWGTIYQGSDNDIFVRYLYWHGSTWYRYFNSLNNHFNLNDSAALIS